MVSGKGKGKVTDDGGKGKGKGKRKWSGSGRDDDKTGRKRKNPGAIQFFDDEAYQVDSDEEDFFSESSGSGFDSEDLDVEPDPVYKANKEPGKASYSHDVKEEVMSEDEFDQLMRDRYKPGSSLVTYAEDGHDHKNSIDRDMYVPSAKDATIWKVKCMVGKERHSAFCLMQKHADLVSLRNKLPIISACSLDHLKGFIIIEAEKQQDIYEACKGLSTIYSSKVTAVPSNEISRLLTIRSKSSAISEDMWVRVKNGRYKGDLGQVVKVNDVRKKVTVKLIPRIDLKSMAEKFGGGVPAKRTAIPAQRLITHSELEEFRPLIQFRRDRDTNLMFEVLDGMMLKDGYLYKKISIDSLSFWGIVPTDDELLKFEPAKKDGSTDEQWLSQLFGEKKKKEVKHMKPGKGGGKSEGSSSAIPENNFELHDLVFIGRKDFGVVIGTDKDNTVKVIKEGSEGPVVVNVKQSELKIASFDRKLFNVLDQHSNTLRANDEVRVLDGPLKDRQGIIKKIYKGVLFLYDETVQENNGYICIKAQLCEKLNLSGDDPIEKVGEPVPLGFPDMTSSPKSPLSPDKPLQERDNNKSNFVRDDNGMFSVGQSLRIRIGPLKGYICRVLAVRRSDVTVKLDSKHKIITVKSEHLSEVRGRNPATLQGEDSGSVKPFGFLGGQDGSNDWMDGAALSTEDNKWNAGGSTERSSWSAAPSSDVSLPKESGSGDPKKEDSWLVKETPNQSSWGAAAANTGWGQPGETQVVGFGESSKGDSSWGKAAEKWNSGSDTSAGKAAWGQSGASSGKQIGDQPETSAWKKDSAGSSLVVESESGAWGSAGGTSNVDAVGWGMSTANKQDSQTNNWNKPSSVGSDSKSSWGKSEGTTSWGKQDSQTKDWATGKGGDDVTENDQTNIWNKPSSVGADSKSSWGKSETLWSKQDSQTNDWAIGKGGDDVTENNQSNNWNKQSSAGAGSKSSWGKSEGTTSWSKQDGGSSWGKKDDAAQEGSWGRSNTFDSGRGSGGRNGRGRGRGGRDNYGRGRSFDQDQSSSWSKEGQFGRSNDDGKTAGWSSSQSGGWGNSLTNEGNKGDDRWDKNVSAKGEVSVWNQGSNANKDGGGKGWGGTNPEGDNSKSSGWNVSKDSNSSDASAWGKSSSDANEQAGAGGSGLSSWDKLQKPNDNTKSSWNAGTTSSDGNQSSGWGKESNWGSQKASEEKSDWNQSGKGGSSSLWNAAKNNDDTSTGWKTNGGSTTGWKKNEDSSTGWGQSNWSKSGTSEAGGNQDSTWSSKGNWNSGGGFNDRNNQDDGGRGGGWRGRGGRGGDRGGFRGRGRSDSGDFGGRGRFGGRGGSDREGGYGGRGGDGFRGRGGFRGGRGRGDWNNREDNSNQDRSSSWGKSSNNDGEGWKSTGNANSWKQRDGDNGGSSSWNQPKDNASSQGWGSSWNQSKGDNSSSSVNAQIQGDTGGSSWGKPSASKETSWNQPKDNVSSQGWNSSWNQSKGDNTSGSGNAQVQGDTGGSGWGKPPANKETSSSWNNNPNSNDGPKAATSILGAPPVNSNASGGWNKPDKSDEGPSNSWGKAATGGWGSGSGSGKGGW